MQDPSLALQAAIVAALKNDAAVDALISKRVYDTPPAAPQKPYVTFGPFQLLSDRAEEYAGADCAVQLDGWSAGPDSVEAKQLAAAMVGALDDQDLALEGHRLVTFYLEQSRVIREPDGIGHHAVVIMRARTEPTT